MIKITRIEKEGQLVWEKNNRFTAVIVTTEFVMNLETLNEYQESNTLWFKAGTEARLEKMVATQIKLIEAGALVPYRVFSETPMYEGQEQDRKINADGSLGEEIGRYSQSKLGLPEKAMVMNRTFITPAFAKVNADAIRSTVATSSLKDDAPIILEETEVYKETIHKNNNVDHYNQYFEEEKKERQRKVEDEKSYSWVKSIFFYLDYSLF
ncbi:hypothetical protein SAMN05216503_2238 [Polaribacter sp. KT25b]|uniref:hypothetical protein n=1 Tax=Polaribacter sp. KT25b TaxID=1855336 RepID=UPI00087CAFF8|nr:hypothetical protein [Polaribacter sp. KT25b]SDS18291.1 hypothetical protein SAMN05216503_2238 [Polaribacter sp. KT25b]